MFFKYPSIVPVLELYEDWGGRIALCVRFFFFITT